MVHERPSPEAVAQRLERLRSVAATMDEREARALMEDPEGRTRPDPVTRVSLRLEELRALIELAKYLGKAKRAR
jgi:hypothetical protein